MVQLPRPDQGDQLCCVPRTLPAPAHKGSGPRRVLSARRCRLDPGGAVPTRQPAACNSLSQGGQHAGPAHTPTPAQFAITQGRPRSPANSWAPFRSALSSYDSPRRASHRPGRPARAADATSPTSAFHEAALRLLRGTPPQDGLPSSGPALCSSSRSLGELRGLKASKSQAGSRLRGRTR